MITENKKQFLNKLIQVLKDSNAVYIKFPKGNRNIIADYFKIITFNYYTNNKNVYVDPKIIYMKY